MAASTTPRGQEAVRIVSRDQWGAMDPTSDFNGNPIQKINVPIEHVCFTHTGGAPCNTAEECTNYVRKHQKEDMELSRLPDISYSFLIGGDGIVYEGRGWSNEPHRPFIYEELYEGRGIEIGYIGDYRGMVGLDRNGVDEISYYGADRKPILRIISREEWGAKPPVTSGEAMLTPLEHVQFTSTDTDSCRTHEECKAILQEIQTDHMETYGFDDIAYSFMIGGNGYVYEGRGWLIEPSRPNAYGDLAGKSYEVAYIGRNTEEIPPKESLKAGMEFLLYVVQAKKVHHFFSCSHLT